MQSQGRDDPETERGTEARPKRTRSGEIFLRKMSYRFFKIPVTHPTDAEQELNGFLQGHSVLAVEKTFIAAGV